jgi:predicted metal-dependent hydrolase
MCTKNFSYKNNSACAASGKPTSISYQSAIVPGMTIPFRGRELTLCVSCSRRKPAVVPDDTSLQINFYQDAPQPPLADILHRWYLKEARHCLTSQTARWAAAMGQHYGRITVKDQHSRWGSCSSLRNLNYNWRLIMAPEPVLNYVVIHEVAHLIELNHSPAFWQIVKTYDLDFQKHKLWLRQNGLRLFQVFPTVCT